MFSDLRFALRSLLKTPGFSVMSVAILALGIGAVTAVFSAVDAVLLRPLPFAHPQELYSVQSSAVNEVGLFSVPEFCTYRDQNHSFAGLVGASSFNTTMVHAGEAQFVQGMRISGNAFTLLGVQPVLGRLLNSDDDRPGAPQVAVIGAELWERAFGGKADVVGQTVSISGKSSVIVGVLPTAFVLPINNSHDDVCVPLQADLDPLRYKHGSLHFIRVLGRISPGVTTGKALSDMAGILQDLRKQFPQEYRGGGTNQLVSLTEQIVGASRPMLFTLFGLVGVLLLLASANLAGLHLVRAIGRRPDFALRTALGASKTRLMRMVLAECLILAVAGGAGALVLNIWGLEWLFALLPMDLPRGHAISLNGVVFAFAAVISMGFGLAPALAPVWLVSKVDLRGAIGEGGRRVSGNHGRIRGFLASFQVAIALALLTCMALFLRSFWAVESEQLGFEKSTALSARLTLPEAGYGDREALVRHYDRLRARLAAVPGIEQVGVTSLLPLAGGLATTEFRIIEQARPEALELPSANYRLVAPDFFATLQIALRQGRGFTERDDHDHPLAVIISQSLADNFFPNRSALGEHLEMQDASTGWRTAEIVGVVSNVKQGKVEDAPSFDLYVPYPQMDAVAVPWLRYRTFWVVRGSLPAAAMEKVLRREIRDEDSTIALSSVRTLAQVTEASLATRRFTLLLVGFFACTALLLTVIGIYSVIAFGVGQRTREFGVRLALGAETGQIAQLVLREGWLILAVGIPLGIAGAFGATQLIATQLYGVGPRDPLAMIGSLFLLAAVTQLACWLPARRAARVDPVVALRAD